MSKSNHQKYGYVPFRRRDKESGFIPIKTWIRKERKSILLNGRSDSSLFSGSIGTFENVRIVE